MRTHPKRATGPPPSPTPTTSSHRCVLLPLGPKPDRVHRPMVPPVALQLRAVLVRMQPHPHVPAPARELALGGAVAGGLDRVGHLVLLDLRQRVDVEEAHGGAVGGGEVAAVKGELRVRAGEGGGRRCVLFREARTQRDMQAHWTTTAALPLLLPLRTTTPATVPQHRRNCSPAAAAAPPRPLTSMELTGASVGSDRTIWPDLTSHTSSPGVSSCVVMISASSCTHAMLRSALAAPTSCCGAASGRSRSKMRSSFSWPPVARRVLPLAKAQQRTMWLCWKESFSVPLRASQTLAEKSADAVAARVAVGSSAHDHTAPFGWVGRGWAAAGKVRIQITSSRRLLHLRFCCFRLPTTSLLCHEPLFSAMHQHHNGIAVACCVLQLCLLRHTLKHARTTRNAPCGR